MLTCSQTNLEAGMPTTENAHHLPVRIIRATCNLHDDRQHISQVAFGFKPIQAKVGTTEFDP